MNKFIKLTTLYAFFANILYGVFFAFMIKFVNSENVITIDSKDIIASNVYEYIFIYFFIGFIINKLGLVIIEPILNKIKFIKVETPERLIQASQINPEIVTISNISCHYRTLMLSTFIVAVMQIVKFNDEYFVFDPGMWQELKVLILLLISVVFLLSYKKQAKFVFYQIQEVLNE